MKKAKKPAQAALCVSCGPCKRVDEDGCCLSCGSNAMGKWADRAMAALDAKKPARKVLMQGWTQPNTWASSRSWGALYVRLCSSRIVGVTPRYRRCRLVLEVLPERKKRGKR